MTKIWAHAGASQDAPANTIEAFVLAIEQNADGIELDVHQSKDGEVVVCHDDAVDMPGGNRVLIRDLTLAELRRANVGDAEFGPASIPTLREVYELLAPTGLELNVELKHRSAPYPAFEERVLELQYASGMADRVVYSSFNHLGLVRVRELDPDADIAPLFEAALIEPWHYVRRLGARAAHPHFASLVPPGVIEGYADAGIAVRAWTVNDPADWMWLFAAGIDAVITDAPGRARRARDAVMDVFAPAR